MDEFCQSLDDRTAGLARAIHDGVIQGDKAVTMSFGAYNNAKGALRYHEKNVIKYALTDTVRGLSFHSMVMYSNDETLRFARARLTGVRLQKGCFTVIAPEAFDLPGFRDFIGCNARQNFQPVIERYARRARRKTSAAQ